MFLLRGLLVLFLVICAFNFGRKAEASVDPASGVIYELSGGRFGDNLLSVAHAKWVAYSLGLPLVYLPFPFSDCFQLSIDPSVKSRTDFSFFKGVVLPV